MSNALSTLAAFALLGGLTWLAFSLDPHWVSKDGQRFLCKVRFHRDKHDSGGRWREVRVFINPDGSLTVAPKGFGGRRLTRDWTLTGSETAGRGRTLYYLSGDGLATMRVPTKSAINDHLARLIP